MEAGASRQRPPRYPKEGGRRARCASGRVAAGGRVAPNGGRFWHTTTIRDIVLDDCYRPRQGRRGKEAPYHRYYRCQTRRRHGAEACPNGKSYPAEKLEGAVWELVSDLMRDPEQLRQDLERMIELERGVLRGDPERETKVWLEKLSEADRKRSGFQDIAAEGLITLDELRTKLAALEEVRETAQRDLEILDRRREG